MEGTKDKENLNSAFTTEVWNFPYTWVHFSVGSIQYLVQNSLYSASSLHFLAGLLFFEQYICWELGTEKYMHIYFLVEFCLLGYCDYLQICI